MLAHELQLSTNGYSLDPAADSQFAQYVDAPELAGLILHALGKDLQQSGDPAAGAHHNPPHGVDLEIGQGQADRGWSWKMVARIRRMVASKAST